MNDRQEVLRYCFPSCLTWQGFLHYGAASLCANTTVSSSWISHKGIGEIRVEHASTPEIATQCRHKTPKKYQLSPCLMN